jgi:hypothetical protein
MNTELVHGEAEVRALVEQALVAIDDDAPAYGEPLARLAGSPAALAILRAQPELARPLFVELRKLRPLTLWVHDRLELALAAKRDGVLDGAVCSLAPGTTLLRPEGRECWLETDALAAETTLRGLPPGWGLIVTGDLQAVSFQALRRASPLRALGALLRDSALIPDTHLDLVIISDRAQVADERRGARVLWSVQATDALQLPPEAAPSIGMICSAEHALACALRLATLRARG